MDTYYVSITQQLIHQEPTEANDYEVQLNQDELSRMQDLMSSIGNEDEYTFKRTPVPYKSADHDDANEKFTDRIQELYQLIYDNGTEKTRETIREQRVLTKLDHTDYDNKGYENSPLNK
ncbi:hypothetical protein [Paenibacillus sp. Marseille-Q4541]|uniref:hypothetical protein n=1 Tax=Paenibacillus sp. Marseille-Q4541 TaxID=2831522 RepID=UPI001BA9EFC6|nr:hypothetical protein [Paenibacillus sp. Marseille-Q4541]